MDTMFKKEDIVMKNEGLKKCTDCDLYPNDCGYWDKKYREKNPNLPKKEDNHNCDYFYPKQKI